MHREAEENMTIIMTTMTVTTRGEEPAIFVILLTK